MSLKPQPLRFQRQGTAASKRIVKGWQLVRVEQFGSARVVGIIGAGPPPALANLRPRLFQHLLVSGILPLHQFFDEAEQPLALLFLFGLRRKQIGTGRRIIDHLGKNHRPRRCQRPPRPPQMQRTRMPVPNRLLPRRGSIDRVERQGDFNEFFAGETSCAERLSQLIAAFDHR